MDKKRFQISLRNGFADRNGISSENTLTQVNSLDYRARVSLVNSINLIFYFVFDQDYQHKKREAFWRSILANVYQQQIDYSNTYCYKDEEQFSIINRTIYEDEYYNVLTLIEFLVTKMIEVEIDKNKDIIEKHINDIFQKEYVGYRYIGSHIVAITDEQEHLSLKESLEIPYKKVTIHLDKSLHFLSDRENPDYANSIKESVSAVEAMCSKILGKSGTLGATLKKIESQGVMIHPALKAAFENLYGYASDAPGIRHSGQLGGKDASFNEAKFMLVSCSAFINYLKLLL